MAAHILVIDNYDSFVYTIVGYLKTLGAEVTVYRNDAVSIGDLDGLNAYDGVLISPGPGTPAESGVSQDVIRLCIETRTPMFGVCLGLQALGEVCGCTVGHASSIMHGKTSLVQHSGEGMFAGVPQPMTATRYHSLAIDPQTLTERTPLRVVATATDDGTIQAVEHKQAPLFAVQFHPESVMTDGGYRLFANWLYLCGQTDAIERSKGLKPKVSASAE